MSKVAHIRRPDEELIGSDRYEPPIAKTMPLVTALSGTGRYHAQAIGHPEIFYAGDVSLLKQQCVAIVGARDATDEAKERAARFAAFLVEFGIVVVSGLAAGIDTAALEATIKAGGNVIAVIGTPLDRAYPAENRKLQEEIYRRHLLISQFPTGSSVHKSNFPRRNKLMALISDATVVMEASDTSGTLHQAAECARLGRWLLIDKRVTESPRVTWPGRFINKNDHTAVVENPGDIIGIYPNASFER